MMSKNKDYERRFIEIRAVDNEEDKMLIEGYAITYESPATHQYGSRKFTETIKRGALDNTDMKDVPLRYNHNDNVMIMARTRNKSLRLIKDEKGLKIEAELLDTQSNRDLYKGIQEGLIDKMSFAFTVREQSYDVKTHTRRIVKINIVYDVSAVDIPAYDGTELQARSTEFFKEKIKEIQEKEARRKRLMLLSEL